MQNNLQTLLVTSLLAGTLSALFVVLSFRVSLLRQKLSIMFGDGKNASLTHAVRAHGNLIESAPLMLILLALLETATATTTFIWIIASIYLGGRILGAIGSFLPNKLATLTRPITMLTTLIAMLITGIMLLRAVI